jgi:hypothetical protein
MPWSARVRAGLLAIAWLGAMTAGLSGCGGGGDQAGVAATADPPSSRGASTTSVGEQGPTGGSRHGGEGSRHDGRAAAGSPHSRVPRGHPVAGAELGEDRPLGPLDVRVIGYRRAGYRGAAAGTRVDLVKVQECAARGPTLVHHRTWRLLDADGRTLGRAGGKMVGGVPSEDLPHALAPGECLTTTLAIGVPARSVASLAQDGAHDTWTLPS